MATPVQNESAWGRFTMRQDAWWVSPLLSFTVLTAFVIYATFRIFEPSFSAALVPQVSGAHSNFYTADNPIVGYHYASPFGNPDLTPYFGWLIASAPALAPFLTPGSLLLAFPASFRFTCYYYRKAYYRSFAMSPPACAVTGATSPKYNGERKLLLFQNLHRYAMYLALIVLIFNFYDGARSILTPHGWHFGLGSLIMILNVCFLSFYTLGCHSFRHLVGGKLNCYSCDAFAHARHSLWARVTMLNKRHQLWAWVSLVWVAVTDLYIRWLALHPQEFLFGVVPV